MSLDREFKNFFRQQEKELKEGYLLKTKYAVRLKVLFSMNIYWNLIIYNNKKTSM